MFIVYSKEAFPCFCKGKAFNLNPIRKFKFIQKEKFTPYEWLIFKFLGLNITLSKSKRLYLMNYSYHYDNSPAKNGSP